MDIRTCLRVHTNREFPVDNIVELINVVGSRFFLLQKITKEKNKVVLESTK